MKIEHESGSAVVREMYYGQVSSKKCIHLLSFLCWFLMMFVGTTIIGIGTTNNSVTVNFCSDSQTFCTENVQFNNSGTYYLYIKITGMHQNNRMFMDYYSNQQLHGQIGNTDHCGSYYTYGSYNKTQTVGGYRVNSTAHLHPCGQIMQEYSIDTVYVIDSEGGTPPTNSDALTSPFHQQHFKRLSQYQLSQWVDVQSQQFINYFTVAATTTKYELVGKVEVSTGDYQLVMQNNFLTQGQFSKQLLISEVGVLGVTNHLMGFMLFAYGILMLFLHIYICFKWRK